LLIRIWYPAKYEQIRSLINLIHLKNYFLILKVIGYYNRLLPGIQIPSPTNRADEIELIKNRMKDFSLTMDKDIYYSLLSDRFHFRKALNQIKEIIMHPNFSNEDMYTQILPDIDNKGYLN